MGTNRRCKDCPADISDRGNRAIRCGYCQRRYRERQEYHRKYHQKNKDRRKNKYNKILGNPDQDEEILDFIRKRRNNRKV